MKNSFCVFSLISLLVMTSAPFGICQVIPDTLPGKYENYTLLPNGWKLSPEGKQVEIGALPLNMIVTKDEQYAITTNSGSGEATLSVIELKNHTEIQRIKISRNWRGISFNKDESLLYASGGNNNCVYIYSFKTGKLSLQDTIILGYPFPKTNLSIAGIAFCSAKNLLLAATRESNELFIINAETKKIVKKLDFPEKCFDVIVNHSGTFAYVSVWGKAAVAVIDLKLLNQTATIKTGDHPCEMIITSDDTRMFVANANNNSVSQIDLTTNKEIEKLNVALTPDAPFGSTPNALSFNGDESELVIANADNNYLSLYNIKKRGNSFSLGFIPTGWYPTSVKILPLSKKILVANGKGLESRANVGGPNPYEKAEFHREGFIERMFKGTIQQMDYPNAEKLILLSKKVFENTPYINKEKSYKGGQSVISGEHNGIPSNKIKYIFYIIKENRTYDQVFGDIKEGNGDSLLTLFPEMITPNQHKLTTDYALFDNFYCDAEVSTDGHNWSTAAYATDYVEKVWPAYYGGQGGTYDFEGGVPAAAPSSGYIWDAAIKANKKVRIYGEFVDKVKDSESLYSHRDEYMKKYTCSTFPGWDMSISDIVRFEKWNNDFEKCMSEDSTPNLSIIRLPNNHTSGTRPGGLTPKAYVAQNDYALGLMIDKISHSKIWNESIVFVVEDDAQNGPDHVDAHRSPLLVISPYVKRNIVDHTMYSTTSVLKTIELILGLPPMTQFDLSATPILYAIGEAANNSPFAAIQPKTDITEKNPKNSYGYQRSMQMDFSREDAVNDIELNEIVWRSVKGPDSEMPSPIRGAFVKNDISKEQNDDDDN